MEDNTGNLQINITANDEASEVMAGLADEANAMADEIAGAADDMTGSLDTVDTGWSQAGLAATQAMNATGIAIAGATGDASALADSIATTMDDIVSSVTGATDAVEVDLDSLDEYVASTNSVWDGMGSSMISTMSAVVDAITADTTAIDEDLAGEDGIAGSAQGAMSSFITMGAAGLVAFLGLKSEIQDSIGDAQNWNETIAAINQELVATGSSLPTDAVVANAQALSQHTLYSQQDILSGEEMILSNKGLQDSYQSLTDMSLDLAAKSGQSVQQTATTLTAALNDPINGLSRLMKMAGVDMPASWTTMIDALAKSGGTVQTTSDIMAALNSGLKDLAEKQALAAGAALQVLGNQLTGLNTIIGNALLAYLDPIVEKMIPIVAAIEKWVEANPKLVAQILLGAAAFAALLIGVGALGIILPAIEEGFALLLSPAGLIGVAILAIAYHFRDDLPAAWAIAKVAFADVVTFFTVDIPAAFNIVKTWIENVYTQLQENGAIAIFKVAWDDIVFAFTNELIPAVEKLWNTFEPYVPMLELIGGTILTIVVVALEGLVAWAILVVAQAANILTEFIKFTSWATTTLYNVLSDIGGWFTTYLINPIKEAIGFIETLISDIGKIGGGVVGGIGSALGGVGNLITSGLKILGDGGIVTSPTLALVGEAGPEAVIPLSMLGSPSAATLGGSGGGAINVYITGTVQSTADQAKTLGDMIAKQIGRTLKLTSIK